MNISTLYPYGYACQGVAGFDLDAERPSSPGGDRRRRRLLTLRWNWMLGVIMLADDLVGARQKGLKHVDA